MWKVDSNFTYAWQKARLRIYLSLLSTYYLNIFNYGQIILNKHLFKGPVTLRRIAPTYADVWKIQQVRWYTLSTLEIRFKHVTNTL